MKVTRHYEREVKKFKEGDQIQIGEYTAIAVERTGNHILFLLDQYLDEPYPMNRTDTNEGGYEESDLRKELQKDEILDIFESIRDLMVPFKNGDLIRIPYAEELFGTVDAYEASGKKQWALMKDRRNRIALRKGDEYEWGWLQNRVKGSAANFAVVDNRRGLAYYTYASHSCGVRPVFRLGKSPSLVDGMVLVTNLYTNK